MNSQDIPKYSRNFLYNVSALFSSSQVLKLNDKKQIKHISKVFDATTIKKNRKHTIADSYNCFYNILLSQYRCEYVYKNEIARQLLLKKHSFNDAKLFTEVEVASSKADVLIINGTSTVYEIKTELDTFDRLQNQLNSYNLVFDKVYVVTHPTKISTLKTLIDKKVGIIVLDDEGNLLTIRQAVSNKKNLSTEHIFGILNKEEYLNIIKKHFGYIPIAQPVYIYEVCKNLFSTLDSKVAHDYMVKELKKRKSSSYLNNFLDSLPDSLKLVAVNTKLTSKDCNLINNGLISRID